MDHVQAMHALRHSHACRIMHAAHLLKSGKFEKQETPKPRDSKHSTQCAGTGSSWYCSNARFSRKIHTRFPKALADLLGAIGTDLGRDSCEAARVRHLIGGIDREGDVGLHVGASWDGEVRRSGCKVADAIRP